MRDYHYCVEVCRSDNTPDGFAWHTWQDNIKTLAEARRVSDLVACSRVMIINPNNRPLEVVKEDNK